MWMQASRLRLGIGCLLGRQALPRLFWGLEVERRHDHAGTVMSRTWHESTLSNLSLCPLCCAQRRRRCCIPYRATKACCHWRCHPTGCTGLVRRPAAPAWVPLQSTPSYSAMQAAPTARDQAPALLSCVGAAWQQRSQPQQGTRSGQCRRGWCHWWATQSATRRACLLTDLLVSLHLELTQLRQLCSYVAIMQGACRGPWLTQPRGITGNCR